MLLKLPLLGSPHAHMLLWLDDAPKYDPENSNTEQTCVDFIDSLISCQFGVDGVIHQQHKHTKTCKRMLKGVEICRFNIPYPPMPRTRILLPFPSDYPTDVKNAGRKNLERVKLYLEETKSNPEDINFEGFLNKMNLTNKQYETALRCSIRRPTVFLKRSIDSCFTNAYLKSLAEAWQANMDVQFILDPFGAARYVCSYITKSSAGVSKLMQATSEQIKGGDIQVNGIINSFLANLSIL
jgi:hypothetical protein